MCNWDVRMLSIDKIEERFNIVSRFKQAKTEANIPWYICTIYVLFYRKYVNEIFSLFQLHDVEPFFNFLSNGNNYKRFVITITLTVSREGFTNKWAS